MKAKRQSISMRYRQHEIEVHPLQNPNPSNPTRKITIIKESWTRTGWLDYWANISLTGVLDLSYSSARSPDIALKSKDLNYSVLEFEFKKEQDYEPDRCFITALLDW
uniref:Uncharacterized protein n=1 Tax=Salix viminalis TaxID=40686 RepID=A0A6N2LYY7_SALVM